MYALRLLGGATLEGADGPLSGYAAQPRQIALLALLATAGGGGLSRDKLLACLWPESSTSAARHGLADAVYRLRKALGEDTIPGHSTTLRLNPRVVRCDVVEFEAALATGDLEAAASLYRGAFLDGFHLRNSSEFEHWKDAEARRLAGTAQAALDGLADRAAAEQDHAEAARWLRRLLALDPFNSRTVMRLMEALAVIGDPANAVKLAAEHGAFLAEELGVEPTAELLRLAERLHGANAAAPRPAGAPLPFELPPSGRWSAEHTGFVAREAELERLHSFLEGALTGDGRVVFVSGEAGTGKTALAREFCRRATEVNADLIVAGGSGASHTGPGDPYLPFREVLDLLSGGVEARYSAGSLAPELAIRIWNLLPVTARTLVLKAPDLLDTFVGRAELAERLRQHGEVDEALAGIDASRKLSAADRTAAPQPALFDQYIRLLRSVAREKPLLLVLDDLQWADGGSVGLLFQLGSRLGGSRILVVALFRPSNIAGGRDGERHPLEPVVNELRRKYGDVEIALQEEGDRTFVDALVDSEPNRLDAGFREALFHQTRGHPLFTVELLRTLREQGMLVRDRGRWRTAAHIDWSLLPVRLEAMLAERLSQVPDRLRRILSIASVEGETFTMEAVADIAGVPAEELLPMVSGDLERRLHLVDAHGFRRIERRRLSEFRFHHVLFQRYLYDQLDRVERAHLNERMGAALERLLGDARGDAPLRLARHFREAGLADKAAEYLYLAGVRAEFAAAFPEAVAHYESALEQLLGLPRDGTRDRGEAETQARLGLARLQCAAPDPAGPLERARVLAEELKDDRLRMLALTGLYWTNAHYPSDNRLGRQISEECLALAQRIGDDSLLACAHAVVALNAGMRGDFTTELASLLEVERLYDPAHRVGWFDAFMDLGSTTQCLIGEALCMLGYPDQGLDRARAAVSLARETAGPANLLVAQWYHTLVHLWRGDAREVLVGSRAVAETADRHGLSALYGPLVRLPLGWAEAQLGRVPDGVATMRDALADWTATGWAAAMAWFTALFAEGLRLDGQAEEGLRVLDDAVRASTAIDELWQEPEIRRIRGDLLLSLPRPDPEAAEAAYRSAMDLARTLKAKWPELRATTHLARLLRTQGRDEEARSLLGAIHGWFTEGFETADLVDAKTLLAESG